MITLAPAALERVRSYLAADPGKAGLRFGVHRTGCSGWGYRIEMADAAAPGATPAAPPAPRGRIRPVPPQHR